MRSKLLIFWIFTITGAIALNPNFSDAQTNETRTRQDIMTSDLVNELWIRIPQLRPTKSSFKYYDKFQQARFAKGVIPFNGAKSCDSEGDQENPQFCIGAEIYNHPEVMAKLKEMLSKACDEFKELPTTDPDADASAEATARSTREGDWRLRSIRIKRTRTFLGCDSPGAKKSNAVIHVVKNMDRVFTETDVTLTKIQANRMDTLVVSMK